jgi:prevent-host-death family protein
MISVPIHKAKARLPELVARACAGEEVVIVRARRPLVRLVPVSRPRAERAFGDLRGKLVVDDAFFDPLPEGELAAWGNSPTERRLTGRR